jgi:probable HAF family extracellular repeat protein
MPLRTSALLAAVAPLLLAAAAADAAPRYHSTDLGRHTYAYRIDGAGDICGNAQTLPALYIGGAWRILKGTKYYACEAMNKSGRAVGRQEANGPQAVEWAPDGKLSRPVPGAVNSNATVIHEDGTIYGAAQMPSGHSFPFMKSGGQLTALPYDPAYDWTQPVAVNRLQQMAGWAGFSNDEICSVNFPQVPELYTNGAWMSLGNLGGPCGAATGLNDSGVVVGWTTLGADLNAHAFSWQGGVMTDLGTLQGGTSAARDINQQGQIVGESDGHAFLMDGAGMIVLDTLVDNLPPGSRLTSAQSINGQGQIAANGIDGTGHAHAYRLDPE